VNEESFAQQLTKTLPLRPVMIRAEAFERSRVSKDMFISLSLENMKVYLVGGFLLAIASVGAIALINFITARRTFGLLRLRGVQLSMMLRILLCIFLVPVVFGIVIGIPLGGVSGYGVSGAVWDLPRVSGAAGFLTNRLVVSPAAVGLVVLLTAGLGSIALGFGWWLFKKTAREGIREA
jgi:hypothetical protein